MFILFFDFTIYFKYLKTNAFFCLDMYIDHFFSVELFKVHLSSKPEVRFGKNSD